MTLRIEWVDSGKEPRCAPDPAFPKGKEFDISGGAQRICTTELPYPAKRIGVYVVVCDICGIRVGLTTAGRPDDPRRLTVPCRIAGEA